jgi:hypothetical protein
VRWIVERGPGRYADILLRKDTGILVTYEKRQSIERSEDGLLIIIRACELPDEGIVHMFDILRGVTTPGITEFTLFIRSRPYAPKDADTNEGGI